MASLLFVDDDPEQLHIWELVLAASGHEVRTARSTGDALRELSASPPDVMMMDLWLPRLADGLSLIRSAGEQGYTGKIVVLSGWPDDFYGRPEADRVARTLVKPVPTQMLLDLLRELVP